MTTHCRDLISGRVIDQVQRRIPVTALNLEDEEDKWANFEYKLLDVPEKTTDPSKFTNDNDKYVFLGVCL